MALLIRPGTPSSGPLFLIDGLPGGGKETLVLSSGDTSGIITTILGNTATFTKGAGREKRVHHSKRLPLPITGERFFFDLGICQIMVN